MEEPLVDKQYLLKKYPGKGGWTYAAIPEVLQNKHAWFGWVKVKGRIDNYELKSVRLMPMGNGQLFFPVKASIRKRIGKQAGDMVHIVLYPDNDPIEIPDELLICITENPGMLEHFRSYSEGEQKAMIEWIFSAKTDDTKVDRIAKTLDMIEQRENLESKKPTIEKTDNG